MIIPSDNVVQNYCYNCDRDVPINIKKINYTMEIKNIKIEFVADAAFCEICREKVSVSKIDNKVIEIAHTIYSEKKEKLSKTKEE